MDRGGNEGRGGRMRKTCGEIREVRKVEASLKVKDGVDKEAHGDRQTRLPSIMEIDSVEVTNAGGAAREGPKNQTRTVKARQAKSAPIKVTKRVAGGRLAKPNAGGWKAKAKAKKHGRTKKAKASGRRRG